MLNFQAHIFWQPFCRTFRYKPQNGEFNQSLRPETTQKQKTMNINNLTIKAQEVLQSAMNLASTQGNQAVEPLHILEAILQEEA